MASAASVAIAGLMASGKSAISRAVAAELRWPRVSFGDEIRAVARERGRGDGLPELQAIGAELVARDPNALCRRVLNSSGREQGMPLIVDGVRHVTVLDVLRGIVVPQRMQLVLVETPVETRRARLRDRGVVDLDDEAPYRLSIVYQREGQPVGNVEGAYGARILRRPTRCSLR